MTATTYGYSMTLTYAECYKCGVPFAMSETLNAECLRDHSRSFYCPNGHGQHYLGETEAQRLTRQLNYATDRAAAERARADGAEASLRATKGHVTRLRKRVIEGECPLCGQHLRDLARHVARVHPGETAEIAE